MAYKLVRRIGDEQFLCCRKGASRSGPSGNVRLQRVQLVNAGRLKREWFAWPLLGLFPSARNTSPSGWAATQPTRHIINLPAREFFRFSGHLAGLKSMLIYRGHALAPDLVELT